MKTVHLYPSEAVAVQFDRHGNPCQTAQGWSRIRSNGQTSEPVTRPGWRKLAKAGNFRLRYHATHEEASRAMGQAARQARPPLAPIPPDPEQGNDTRAAWAGAALATFRNLTGADIEDAVADLLCNLRHFCDRNGFDWDNEQRRAAAHYTEETAPE